MFPTPNKMPTDAILKTASVGIIQRYSTIGIFLFSLVFGAAH
jgi:hypothetical protein